MARTEERLQKILSECGVASRRSAEKLIEQGLVKVNGRTASVGDKAMLGRDLITVDGKRLTPTKEHVYIMLNKPRGYVTTMSDELGRRCVAELVEDAGARVYPVGRLDKDSEGLLLLTNDGRFANQMMHPRYHISKVYRVTVRPSITDEQVVRMMEGVDIDTGRTAPANVKVLDKQPGRVVLEVTIYEGKNRQVRKMCEAVGLEVARLSRKSIGGVKLGMLPPGRWRELTKEERRLLTEPSKK